MRDPQAKAEDKEDMDVTKSGENTQDFQTLCGKMDTWAYDMAGHHSLAFKDIDNIVDLALYSSDASRGKESMQALQAFLEEVLPENLRGLLSARGGMMTKAAPILVPAAPSHADQQSLHEEHERLYRVPAGHEGLFDDSDMPFRLKDLNPTMDLFCRAVHRTMLLFGGSRERANLQVHLLMSGFPYNTQYLWSQTWHPSFMGPPPNAPEHLHMRMAQHWAANMSVEDKWAVMEDLTWSAEEDNYYIAQYQVLYTVSQGADLSLPGKHDSRLLNLTFSQTGLDVQKAAQLRVTVLDTEDKLVDGLAYAYASPAFYAQDGHPHCCMATWDPTNKQWQWGRQFYKLDWAHINAHRAESFQYGALDAFLSLYELVAVALFHLREKWTLWPPWFQKAIHAAQETYSVPLHARSARLYIRDERITYFTHWWVQEINRRVNNFVDLNSILEEVIELSQGTQLRRKVNAR